MAVHLDLYFINMDINFLLILYFLLYEECRSRSGTYISPGTLKVEELIYFHIP